MTRTEVENCRERLDAAFEQALRPVREVTGSIGVLFSGGVDSALIAWELREKPQLMLCTLGRDESEDLASGRAAAARLGLAWEGLRVDEEQVRAAERRFSPELSGVGPVPRSVLLALALAIEAANPPSLVCGQGADELFLGYAHFRGRDGATADRRAREDLERLLGTDWPRTQRIAETAGRRLFAPYLAPEFQEAALRIPIEFRLPGDLPKRFFREWAVSRGLPPELAARPKKALQYGSGVDALLRRRARGSKEGQA